MLLSEEDIRRLEKAGYVKNDFACYDKHGVAQLLNSRGYCVFYDARDRSCRVYKLRPLGCRIYPVVYGEGEGIVVDDLCPADYTISDLERERKGKILVKLLSMIDREAEQRGSSV